MVSLMVALIHWRIKPDEESNEMFLNHWKTNNTIGNRSGLIAEFLSEFPANKRLPVYHLAFRCKFAW